MYGEKAIKGKKDVMIMIKSRIKVINVEYEEGKVELISAQSMTKYGEIPKIVVA